MSIYTIGDLHLSLGCEKPMDIFRGWSNYVEKIKENWNSLVKNNDTVIICGDISWAMGIENAYEDFKFINNLTGNKIILKGNHDYWWTTFNKMEKFLKDNHFDTIKILHNNSYVIENIAVCGSRGWIFEQGESHDTKIIDREVGRLRTSLLSVKDENLEKIVFLHYPPVYNCDISEKIMDTLKEFNIKKCYYGHIHGSGHRFAIDGIYDDIDFHLISADYVGFKPILVL